MELSAGIAAAAAAIVGIRTGELWKCEGCGSTTRELGGDFVNINMGNSMGKVLRATTRTRPISSWRGYSSHEYAGDELFELFEQQLDGGDDDALLLIVDDGGLMDDDVIDDGGDK